MLYLVGFPVLGMRADLVSHEINKSLFCEEYSVFRYITMDVSGLQTLTSIIDIRSIFSNQFEQTKSLFQQPTMW